MIINNNISALNNHRQMGINQKGAQNSMQKLSSGLRINKAGDDAAGLAISEKMRGQIRGLDQASRNSQDGISMIQTAEGALQETHNILQRMRELAVQAANDTNVEVDRNEIQKEMNQLTSEINRIGNTTEFNTQKVLKGQDGAVAANVVIGDLTFTANEAGFSGNDFRITLTTVAATTAEESVTVSTDNDGITTINVQMRSGADTTSTATNQHVKDAIEGHALASSLVSVSIADGQEAVTRAVAATPAALIGGDDTGAAVDFSANLQIGANQGQSMTITIADMRAQALGISGGAGLTANGVGTSAAGATFASSNNVTDGTNNSPAEASLDVSNHTNATSAVEVLNQAIERVSAERSQLGAFQNRLEHTISNLGNSAENLQAAESRIRDVDMAREVMDMTKNNILSQASQAMLAQANQAPQAVLQLLG